MDKDERVPTAPCNERRRHDGLAERGRGSQYAVVVVDERIESLQLRLSQFTLEANACGKRCADFALVLHIGDGACEFRRIPASDSDLMPAGVPR